MRFLLLCQFLSAHHIHPKSSIRAKRLEIRRTRPKRIEKWLLGKTKQIDAADLLLTEMATELYDLTGGTMTTTDHVIPLPHGHPGVEAEVWIEEVDGRQTMIEDGMTIEDGGAMIKDEERMTGDALAVLVAEMRGVGTLMTMTRSKSVKDAFRC
jgi:hypothetical protein